MIVPANFWLRRSGETAGCTGYSATDCLLRDVETPTRRVALFTFGERLPDEYRTRVRVCFAHATGAALAAPQACNATTRIDVSLFADEIYGRRLMIEPNMTSAAFSGTTWSPQLKLDGTTLATLNVSTPLSALNGAHGYTSNRTGALRLEVGAGAEHGDHQQWPQELPR